MTVPVCREVERLLKNLGEHGNAELIYYNELYVLQTYLEVIVFRLDAQLRR